MIINSKLTFVCNVNICVADVCKVCCYVAFNNIVTWLVYVSIYSSTIGALEEKNYSIRIWVANNTSVNIANDLHYHGIIKVLETKDTESEELK